MAYRSSALLFVALATINLAWCITFSGNAKADFSATNALLTDREKASLFTFDRTTQVTCGDWMAGASKASNPWKTIQPEVRRSGMDMDAVHMMYDDINDRLYVGIECGAICGDIDGDGNPSGTDPNAVNREYNGTKVNLGTDIAGMCESELFSWMFWNSPPSNYDPTKTTRFYPNIIVGLRLQDCLVNQAGNTELRAYEFTKGSCQPNFTTTAQSASCANVNTLTAQTSVGFGPTITSQYGLPPLVIEKQSLYLNATHPHVEFYLPSWSQYPTFNTWDTPALLPFEPAKETKAGQAPFSLAFKAKSAAVDDCGEDTVSPQLWTIKWDCAGWPNGNAVYDVCGDCAGPGLRCRDCNGTVNGTLVLDNYGVCGGNNSADCSGNPYGTLKYDRCNVCDGHDECVDCFDVPFGTAVVDKYGVCGGNNYADCEGNPFGSKVYDDCGVCGGDNTSCSCQHYLGYDLADVDYALLRWTVQASLIKINDTLEVLEAIRAKLAASEYKSGSAASFVDYIDILHDFCDDCLDSFDSAQIWFASYLSEACDGIQCAPTPLSGTEWTL